MNHKQLKSATQKWMAQQKVRQLPGKGYMPAA